MGHGDFHSVLFHKIVNRVNQHFAGDIFNGKRCIVRIIINNGVTVFKTQAAQIIYGISHIHLKLFCNGLRCLCDLKCDQTGGRYITAGTQVFGKTLERIQRFPKPTVRHKRSLTGNAVNDTVIFQFRQRFLYGRT